eukprot:TRINITY_DN7622_c0_g1_i1.p1 TRINITY_DN7622_c0_g1~~TRINITY_DN7622_c0_g1_i1.p1  ORF type:complete len:178 (+),score=46.79 TRINITY_DN7622_c0_g1_i1:194-727(+)
MTVSTLLKNFSVNAMDKAGQTPLHIAAAGGNKTVCRLLLQAGADANLEDLRCETCIEVASRSTRSFISNFMEKHKYDEVDEAARSDYKRYEEVAELANTSSIKALSNREVLVEAHSFKISRETQIAAAEARRAEEEQLAQNQKPATQEVTRDPKRKPIKKEPVTSKAGGNKRGGKKK